MAVLSLLGGWDVYEARYISFLQKIVLGLEVICPVRASPKHPGVDRETTAVGTVTC